MKYLTRNGQSLFDLANATYGSLDYCYQMISGNTDVYVNSVPVSVEVEFTPVPIIPSTVKSIAPNLITSAYYYSRQNQTVYDICLQVYGSLNFLFKMINDSGFSNLNTYPSPSTSFNFNPQLNTDILFKEYLSRNNIILTSGGSVSATASADGLLTDDGVQIQTDGGIDIIID